MWRKLYPTGPDHVGRHRSNSFVELLESRTLLSVATVNAGTTLRAVASNSLGVDTAPWDSLLSPLGSSGLQTLSLSQAAGIDAVRFGGGSYVDENWHFNVNNPSVNPATIGDMAEYAAELGANAIVDVNYGTGSPEEAVALWAYLDGSPSDTTSIAGLFGNNAGDSEQWNTTTKAWVSESWNTVGYWASLREAAPLTTNDGLNFLRLDGNGTTTIDHPAAFNFTNWEIGNEVYGSWEMDEHGAKGDALPMPGSSTPKAHDPTTLISFAKQFQTAINTLLHDGMESGASPISIGYDSQAVDNSYGNWIAETLQQSASQGFTPGFIADHWYTNDSSGDENDAGLLAVSNNVPTSPNAYTNLTNPYNWATRAADYDNLFNEYLPGDNIQLIADEVNSISNDPGEQSTSLVNGLFIADAIGSAMASTGADGLGGYQGIWVWDLHNGAFTANYTSSSLYGWRMGGDYGILGNNDGASAPIDGTNEPYPDYFALQLASKIMQNGGTVVSATEDNETNVDTYAVLEANGDLELLVVNKTSPGTEPPSNLPDPTLTEQFDINGFNANSHATIWQYGVAQDDAQDNASNDATSLADITTNLSITNGDFSYALPDYSMSVIILTPQTGPTVATAAAANPNPVTGTSTALSVLGAENGTDSGLNYTWSATGPASVTYTNNTNGTNLAKNITANFTQAGSYTFTATITDSGGLFTTSQVAVTVQQTPAGVMVSPSSTTVATGGTAQLSATAVDQFGNAISSPTFGWSITGTSDGNSINSAGLATLGSTPGTYTVTATLGSADNTATVIAAVAPAVSNFIVNDGSAQRSMVDSLTVVFNEPVTLASNAITLNLLSQTGGASTPITLFNLNSPDGGTTWVLTFTDPSYIGSSLPDGAYALDVTASGVSSQGLTMTGSNPSFTFWRLYGDFTGQGVVNGTDFGILALIFGTQTNSSNWYVDYNGDGVINGTDFGALASRFGTSINIPAQPSVTLLAAAPAPISTTTTTMLAATATKPTITTPPTPQGKHAAKPVRHEHQR